MRLLAQTTVITPLVDRPGVSTYTEATAAAIDAAVSSVDLLLSTAEVEGVPLWEPLVRASGRGVRVRVLLDASGWAPEITEKNERAAAYLSERGIECRFDDPDVTTHAKLVVVDRCVVVVGSTNWNRYAFSEHEQANVVIDDPRVGEAFAQYFDRLWDGRLATDGVAVDLAEALAGGPTIVPLPDGPGTALCGKLLLELLPRARRSVHLVMYRVSVYPNYPGSLSNGLIDGLIDAAGRGLDVRVLIDDCSFYRESADANLASAIYLYQHGIEVRFDTPERTTHAKLIVIDGESVVVGSTNWNYYALEENVEANVALLGMPGVASAFDAFFELLWREGRPIGP